MKPEAGQASFGLPKVRGSNPARSTLLGEGGRVRVCSGMVKGKRWARVGMISLLVAY